MPYQFTSIAHSIEKLLEAEYFLAGIVCNRGDAFQYNLNAYLAACRSISLVLQKSMSSVPKFEDWYEARRKEMKADAAMSFFVELRNISLHEGPVSFVGGSISQPPGWTYRFAGNREAVPAILMGQDVAGACADHLTKLAKLLKSCAEAFPYNYCIVNALTLNGLANLNYTLRDVEKLLGLPSSYSDVDNAWDRTVVRMIRTVMTTTENANGQIVEHVIKNKDLFLSEDELKTHLEELKESQDGLCAITGIPLQWDGEADDSQLLCSLDRIDSGEHYDRGNLQLVCRFINFWKNNSNDAEFRRLIEVVRTQAL